MGDYQPIGHRRKHHHSSCGCDPHKHHCRPLKRHHKGHDDHHRRKNDCD
jgi:hypothetical protein